MNHRDPSGDPRHPPHYIGQTEDPQQRGSSRHRDQEDDQLDDDRSPDRDERHYYQRFEERHHHGDSMPKVVSPFTNYFWQLLGSVSSAAIAGMFFWLWNVTLDIRDLQNARNDITRVAGEVSTVREILDRAGDRLTKLEVGIEQNRDGVKNNIMAIDTMRNELRQIRDALGTHTSEYVRISEIVRQLDRLLNAHIDSSTNGNSHRPPLTNRDPSDTGGPN